MPWRWAKAVRRTQSTRAVVAVVAAAAAAGRGGVMPGDVAGEGGIVPVILMPAGMPGGRQVVGPPRRWRTVAWTAPSICAATCFRRMIVNGRRANTWGGDVIRRRRRSGQLRLRYAAGGAAPPTCLRRGRVAPWYCRTSVLGPYLTEMTAMIRTRPLYRASVLAPRPAAVAEPRARPAPRPRQDRLHGRRRGPGGAGRPPAARDAADRALARHLGADPGADRASCWRGCGRRRGSRPPLLTGCRRR